MKSAIFSPIAWLAKVPSESMLCKYEVMLGQVQDSGWQIDTEGKAILSLAILSTEIVQKIITYGLFRSLKTMLNCDANRWFIPSSNWFIAKVDSKTQHYKNKCSM